MQRNLDLLTLMSIRNLIDKQRSQIHTFGMKVAVSIPDSLFADAEALAKQKQISRSKLYARALSSYVANNAEDRVTELANLAADELGTAVDPIVRAGARTVLKYTQW